MQARGEPFGFFKTSKARHALEAIGHTEELVTVLRLSQAEIRPAEDALRVAKLLYEAQDYSKALTQARRAESLAVTLDERFNGYHKAWNALNLRIAELKRLGLHTEPYEGVVGQAEEKVMTGIWENGSFVPNYLEAKVLLERAAEEGRDLLVRANGASSKVFLAELAIEALADLQAGYAEGACADLEQALEGATRELALGNVDEAARVAADIEARAERLRKDFAKTKEGLESTEARLAGLRSDGVVTERLEAQIRYARDMLSKGLIEPAASMARRLDEEAASLGEAHTNASTGLADADVLYQRLQGEGFHSYEAETALTDARKALRAGNYPTVLEHVERAHQAFVRRRNARESLARALADTRSRVGVLQGRDVPLLPDIQDVLGRAEREFSAGNFSGATEDLQLATTLLNQATGARPEPAQ